MDEMKYLPPAKKSKRLRWILIGLAVFIAYVTIGNSTSTENLQQFVSDRSAVEVERYSDFTVGTYSIVVLIRDNNDGRTAMSFVKVPLMDRWNLTSMVSVKGTETKPILMDIDNGFGVLKTQVSFERVNILGNTDWSGTYAKTISILIFMLLAVGINVYMNWIKRPQKPEDRS
jgi:hypothetical protein